MSTLDPVMLEAMSREQMIDLVLRLHRSPVARPDGLTGSVQIVALRLGHGLLQVQDRQGQPVGAPFITAEGYYALALAAGFTIQSPSTLRVGDVERGNPYIERDPETGSVDAVHVRKVVSGRNAAGDPIVRDQTVVFSPWWYLLEELRRRAETSPAIRGTSFVIGERPSNPSRANIHEIKLPGGLAVGMEIDAADDTVRVALQRYAGRLKKAVEIAQTFCDRNALRKALGVPASPPMFNLTAYIPVTSWFGAVDVDAARARGIVVEERTTMAEVDAAQAAFEAADPDEADAGELHDAMAEALSSSPTTPPSAATSPAPADLDFTFEEAPLRWVAAMVDRGDALRAQLGADRFQAICARAGVSSETWSHHGQETMRLVVATAAMEATRD